MCLNLSGNCGTETCKRNSSCAFSSAFCTKKYVGIQLNYMCLCVCVCVCVCACVDGVMLSILHFQVMSVLFTCCTVWGSDDGGWAGIICCVCCTQLLFCLDCILFGLERETWAPGWACGMRRRTFPTAFVRPSRKTCSYIYRVIEKDGRDLKPL
jgi:hypothetical protein